MGVRGGKFDLPGGPKLFLNSSSICSTCELNPPNNLQLTSRLLLGLLPVDLRNLKTVRLGRVENAAVRYNPADTLPCVDAWTGRDHLIAGRDVDHVHIGTDHIGLRQAESRTGVFLVEGGYKLAGVLVYYMARLACGAMYENGIPSYCDNVDRLAYWI